MKNGRPLAGMLLLVMIAGCGADAAPIEGLMDRETFRCYAVSESMRTVAPGRIEHKKIQLRRMRRVLETARLEPADEAKVRAEYAITLWDAEDARFLRACAQAYYKPGSAHVRESFEEGPVAFQTTEARTAFRGTAPIEARLLPHGFAERARLHEAEIALMRGEFDEAAALSKARLEEEVPSLYEDTFQVVQADALLQRGRVDEALALYREAGKLKIGVEAYYARYRLAKLLRAIGESEEAETLEADLLKWAERGDREALLPALRGAPTLPPPPRQP